MAEKRNHIVWMLEELPRLRASGLIPEETEKVLLDHYRAKLETFPAPQKVFAAVLAVLGIVMAAAGIVLFVNHNWDMLPKAARMGVSCIPLVIGAVLGYVTIARNKGQLWREAAAVFTATGAAVLTAMLSQIYHINGEMSGYIFLVLLLALPQLYIFDSFVLACLYVLFSFFLMADGGVEAWRCGVAAAGFAPFLARHLRENARFAVPCRYLAPVAALSALIGCGTYHFTLPALALCGVFIVSGMDLLDRKAGLLKAPWLLPAFAVQMFILGAGSCEEDVFYLRSGLSAQSLWVYWVFTAAVLLLFIFVFMRRRLSGERALNALFVLLTLIPFATDAPVMRIVCNIALGLGGIVCMRGGFVRRSFLLFNGGAVMLTVLTACRFFDSEIGVLYRSAGLTLLGLGFIIANVVCMKKSGRA